MKPSTRTEFERWLNDHPSIDDPRYIAMRNHRKNWGHFLRWKFPAEFDAIYVDFWLTHPEKWPEVYANVIPESDIPYA